MLTPSHACVSVRLQAKRSLRVKPILPSMAWPSGFVVLFTPTTLRPSLFSFIDQKQNRCRYYVDLFSVSLKTRKYDLCRRSRPPVGVADTTFLRLIA